jgi:hypothetical protein
MHEVQQVSRHAHGHRHGLNRADVRGVSPHMRSSPGSASSISPGTVLHANEDGTEIGQDYVHLEVCNSCGVVRLFLACFRARRLLADESLFPVAHRWS